MILPTTYQSALLLLFVSMICWGSWANTFKLVGPRWRFELFYFDYSLGLLLGAIIAAYTFGSMGADMTFADRMLVASRTQMLWVFCGGIVFNLANMLLVAAISLAGMAVAFPVGIGLALVIGVALNYVINPQGNPVLLFAGSALVLIAVIVDAMAYRARDAQSAPVPGVKGAKSKVTRGLLISLLSGVLMGVFYPLVEKGMPGDLGLGPYASLVIFAVGVFLSTFFFNIYFMNLPIVGERIQLKAYFHGRPYQHLLGIGGGIVWSVGALTNFLGATTPPAINVGPAISLAIGQCGTLVTVLWGLLVWKEFAGSSGKVITLVVAMIALFVAGLVLLSLAPLVKF